MMPAPELARLAALAMSAGAALFALARLTISRRRLRAASDTCVRSAEILQSVAEPLVVVGADGLILEANRRAGEVLGRPPASLQGRRFEEILHEDEREAFVREKLPGILRGEPLREFECRWIGAAGEEVPLRISPSRLRGRGAAPEAVVLSARDVREETRLLAALGAARATLEEKVRERTADLTRAYAELKSLDAMKDAFLSSVSHELRTPLSSIRAFGEILLAGGDEPEPTRREFLTIIHRESERLGRLVDDLLDLSKMESGRTDWRLQWIDLSDLLRQAAGAIRPRAVEAGLRLVEDLPVGLPPVWGDRDRLMQVFRNILDNAVKFTPAGGEISMRVSEIPGRRHGDPARILEVRIGDTGIGIPEGQTEAIFQRFRQAGDSLTEKPAGAGLGLPICREILQRQGGTIRAERREAGGSFLIVQVGAGLKWEIDTAPAGDSLPAVAAREPQDLAIDLREPADAAAVWDEPPEAAATVAVADDDAGVRGVLAESLRARGFRVLEAADGAEAMGLVKRGAFDLLILDLQMPKVSGWKVLNALRGEPSTARLPVIVLTGWVSEGDRARALALGAVEYLQKGQGLARLCREIELATGRLPVAGGTASG